MTADLALTAAVPGRMPEQLVQYWVHGKGAAKIRWGTPGDFKRCVHHLVKYFPRNPEGLCNRLHVKALGVPPGQEHTLIDFAAEVGFYRDVSTAERKRLADKGHAMPDGSYPIETVDDLDNAIQAVGRAKPGDRAAVRRHIMKRARALGVPEKIPDGWRKGHSLAEFAAFDEAALEALLAQWAGEPADDEYPDDTDETLYPEEADLVPMRRMWRGRLAPIGVPTGDRRRFAPGGISNRDLPLPLLYQKMTSEGHASSVVVGRILGLTITDDSAYGWGDWMPETDDVRAAQQLLTAGVGGPSVDLDDIEYELRVPGTDQVWLANDQCSVETGECSAHEFVVTKGRIAAATIVAIPAFAEAKIELYDEADEDGLLAAFDAMIPEQERSESCGCGMSAAAIDQYCAATPPNVYVPRSDGEAADVWADVFGPSAEVFGAPGALTAAVAGTFAPPAAAFADPGFRSYAQAVTLDDTKFPGYTAIYGHVAPWDLPHVGLGRTAPKSRTGYAYFHLGEIYTAEGDSLAVGKLVYGGKHPSMRIGLAAAQQHYDDTTKAVAVVRAGEDAHGIWIAGVVLPWVDEATKLDLGLSPLSGDWRRAGGNYEMIAALAVNVPGFPVLREHLTGGRGLALVASAGPRLEVVEDDEVTLTFEGGRIVARTRAGASFTLKYEPESAPAAPDPARVKELFGMFREG